MDSNDHRNCESFQKENRDLYDIERLELTDGDATPAHPSDEYERDATMVSALPSDTTIIDDKSVVRRAYELIDRTARRTRLTPTTSQEESIDLGLVVYESTIESFESDPTLPPAAARANAKAASAYVADTSERNQVPTGPGVEYIQSRAPGLDRSFYLPLLRLHNFIRANDTQQAECRHATTAESSLEPARTELSPPVPNLVDDCNEEKTTPDDCNAFQRRLCCVYVFIAVCSLIATGVGIVYSAKKRVRAGSNQVSGNGLTTRFSPYTTDCNALTKQQQPNVVSQCNCSGAVSIVAADIAARYYNLTENFIHSVLPEFDDTLTSCSPQNQALLWLASGDGFTSDSRLRQRYTFALLYILWNGPNWFASANWMSISDECTWQGLNCNNQGKVIGIDSGSNNAVVDLSPVASLLANIESLKVDYNTIQGNTIPTEVGLLTNLTNLILTDTGIVGTLPMELFDLGSSLQVFVASQNSFSGTISTLIGKLSQLERLSLDGRSKLNGTIPTQIGSCTKLVELRLSGNDLTGALPSALGSLSSLETIYVNSNDLTGTLPTQLGDCISLSRLVVNTNRLQGTVPSELSMLPSLIDLEVGGNRLVVPDSVCHLFEGNFQACDGCNCGLQKT